MRRLFIIAAIVYMAAANAQTYEQMRDSLEEAADMVRKFPENIDLRLRKASWNMLLEQWEYAKAEYDEVLKRDTTNVAALYYRAYTYERLHRYAFARRDYEKMLKVVPGDFNGQLGLALLNQKDMRYTEAMNMANHLVEQYPDNALAYAARAGMEVEREMLDVALYDFSKAIQLDPENTDYLISRADLLIRMGRKKEARQDLDKAVSKGIPKPSLADLYNRCRE
jgi:tetratricopeptide (TPR) repeat protein